MPSPRLRHTARALLLDPDDRILLARHDLTQRHYGEVIWAPPGGGLEPGESPVDAVVRELREEVGYDAAPDDLRHVWHQVIISTTYAKDWDGAIHDYFVVRCTAFVPHGSSPDDLHTSEGITDFRWWSPSDLDAAEDPAVFRPRDLPTLFRDVLTEPTHTYPRYI